MRNRAFCTVQIIFSIILSLSFLCIGHAATLTVNSPADTNDGSWGNGTDTLREAIAHASSGDTITFSLSLPATISITSTLTIGKNLTINGPTTSTLSVSGNNTVRVFDITAGTVTVSYLTIKDGYLPISGDGAGFYVRSGATLNLNDSEVSSNFIDGNEFFGTNGAGIYVKEGATLHVNRSNIHSNSTTGTGSQGAGLCVLGGTATVTDSTFSNNAGAVGAAVYIDNYVNTANVTLTNCTISNNNSTRLDGVVALQSGNLTMNNCTVTANVSAEWEAGVFADTGTLILRNTIIADNLPSNGQGATDIFFDTNGWYNNDSVVLISYGYNLIGSTGEQPYTEWTAGDVVGTESAKQIASLAALADNGGPTLTHALNAGSQAINPASSNGAPQYDQRGASRSGTADKGAYEYNGVIADSTPPTVSAINRANANPTNANSVTFTVTFDESVNDIETGDFTLVTTGTVSGSISSVSASSGSTVTVTVDTISGNGTLGLNFDFDALDSVVDAAGNAADADFIGQTYTIDNTSPAVSSINRANTNPTNANSVTFTVTFDESVSDIETGDFALVTTGTASGLISSVSASSGSTVTVTVDTISGNGTLGLNFDFDALDSVVDAARNAADADFIGQTYTIDNTAPAVSSINRANANPTNATSVTFTVTFDVTVSDIETGDFAITTTGTVSGSISSVSASSGSSVTVTVDTISGDGTLGLNFDFDALDSVVDAAGNAANADFIGQTYSIDNTAPTVTINQATSQSDPATTSPINFTVVFNEPVSGFNNPAEVILSGTAIPTTATISEITPNDNTTYNVAVSGMTSAGTVAAIIPSSVAQELSGNGNTGSTSTDNVVTFSPPPPTVVSINRNDADPTNAASVEFSVMFDKVVSGIDTGDFALSLSGTTGSIATVSSGSGTMVTVTVDTITGAGTLGLNLVDDDSIMDIMNVPLDGAGSGNGNFIGQIYTVDRVSPTVTDANINISGATGTGGAYKVGDIVTATWNNSESGDNNNDIASVTVDFSQFGGGTAVFAGNTANTWTTTFIITENGGGPIDATNCNVSMTATDTIGNSTTTPDEATATVDNDSPVVTDTNISISGATGKEGKFRVGDTVTATWDNTGSGDNNSDTINMVTIDFNQFGGGPAVAASNSNDTWTASYIIRSDVTSGTNKNINVTGTDNAGNSTTTADTSNATIAKGFPWLILMPGLVSPNKVVK